MPQAACTMHHAPFAILQSPFSNCQSPIADCRLPIETETVNTAPSACRIVRSTDRVDAKVDAKFRCQSMPMPESRCQGSSITAFVLGRDTQAFRPGQKSRKVAKWPGQVSPETRKLDTVFGLRLGFVLGLWHSWVIMLDPMGSLS